MPLKHFPATAIIMVAGFYREFMAYIDFSTIGDLTRDGAHSLSHSKWVLVMIRLFKMMFYHLVLILHIYKSVQLYKSYE